MTKILAKDTRIIIVALIWLFIFYGIWFVIKPWIAEYNYRQGYVNHVSGRYTQSVFFLDKANRYAPWETYYLITQVKNYERLASRANINEKERLTLLNKALSTYEYMIQINPTNPWYHNGLASINLALFNYAKNPEERKKYFENAEKAYKNASEIDDLNPLFKMSLAYFYHRSRRIDEAYDLYKRASELDDWMVEAFYNLAEIDLYKKNYNQSILYFEAIAKADKFLYNEHSKKYAHWVKGGNFKNYRAKLGELYLSNKDLDKAIEMFTWALENHQNDANVWRSLGVAYHQAGKLENAIYAYKQALSFNPKLIDLYKYLGYLYYNVGLLNSAVENLSKYIKLGRADEKAVSDLRRMQSVLRRSKKNR